MEKVLNKIIKYGLYVLVFLVPIFFLPWSNFPLVLNKQTFLAVSALLLLILWIIKVISSGELRFTWNKIAGAVLLFLAILGISTALSGARLQSFWGMSFEPDTFFSFILCGLVFFLFANLLSGNRPEQAKSAVVSALKVFLASAGVLSILFWVQRFKPIFPWDFSRASGFNPVGTVQSLALFLGGAFVILMALIASKSASNQRQISGKPIVQKLAPVLSVILGVLLFVSIFLINNWAAWLGLVLAMPLIIWSQLKFASGEKISRQEGFTRADSLKVTLFLLVFVIALTCVFVKPPIRNLVNLPGELTLTYKASLDIAKETLLEGSKNFVFGSGPATFVYDYDLHRTPKPNITEFWQVRFTQGLAAFPTFLACLGALGIVGILLVMISFFYKGFKDLGLLGNLGSAKKSTSSQRRSQRQINGAQLATFAGGFYFLISWFFYSVNLTLLFSAFLMIGLFTACSAEAAKQKSVVFTKSPQFAFAVMLIGVILIVGSGLALYNVGQRYTAALAFAEGLSSIQGQEPDLDKSITQLSRAAGLDKNDLYLRNLSQAFLLRAGEIVRNPDISSEERQSRLQNNIAPAEAFAKSAVDINPSNSQNWKHLGMIYESFIAVGVEKSGDFAVLNYQKAAELDPQDPRVLLSLARVYKALAERQSPRVQRLEMALVELEKAIQLKSNFALAYDLMAQVYLRLGRKDQAIAAYQMVLRFEPRNESVRQRIEELSR